MERIKLEVDTFKLLYQVGSFYHVTSLSHSQSIDFEGLQPKNYPLIDYHTEASRKNPQICLCLPSKLDKWISALSDKYDELVIYEVQSENIIGMDIGFDWTNDGAGALIGKTQLEQFKIAINELGVIACYETIPPKFLKRQSQPNRFTLVQLNKVTETLYLLLRCSDTLSNIGGKSEISKVKMYYDDMFNYYISYNSVYYGDDGRSYDTFYLSIDSMGAEVLLNNNMRSDKIEELFKTLKPLPKVLPPNIRNY